MFYDLFCELCKKKGVSPTKATVEIGLSRTIGTKWKTTGATPQGDTLSKIAAYFDVSVDYLLGNEQEKKPVTSESDELQDECIAYYGEVKPYLDERDINDLKIFMKAKADYKRKKQNDEGRKG